MRSEARLRLDVVARKMERDIGAGLITMGEVLGDGRNRLKAMELAGVQFNPSEARGVLARAFTLSSDELRAVVMLAVLAMIAVGAGFLIAWI
jgi:hypothetical protein